MMSLCSGITKKKLPCRIRVAIRGYYCRYHVTQELKTSQKICKGITSSGKPCTLLSLPSDYVCSFHHELVDYYDTVIIITISGYFGVFNSLEKAEESAMTLQNIEKNCELKIRRTYLGDFNGTLDMTIKKNSYYSETPFSTEMSLLKIDCLINLINKFVGYGYVWCLNKHNKHSLIPYNYTDVDLLKSDGDFHLIKLNTIISIASYKTK